MKKLFILFFVFLFVTNLAACSSSQSSTEKGGTLKKVSVVLDWTPNTNHTGIYVAKEKGYFKEHGLDVNIILPGEAGADQLVASGKSEFGVSYQEGITQARIQGIPIVSLAAVIQHNTSGFASPKAKNIVSPKDFEGKTYGGWGSPIEKAVINSLMKQENADVEKVKVINMGDADFFTAVNRDIDFAWIYYGWTGVEAEIRNEPINMVYLTDYTKKLDYYTPVITTNEKMIKEDSETVKAFMAALTKGYEFAIEQPADSADILIKAVPDLDGELVKKSQEWLSPRYQNDAERWGEQKLEVWQNYSEWMFDNGLLEKELEAEKAFTNEFLPKRGK
ncbi:ABC transporter substrate-binding protein [Mesobacillus selenatarsenatis]|uniref:Hydroxymethylpyrimidine ABC transporter, substrate-binding component n=1 Tax=Mesobacillus selenatarsenatis (strain DSM 18680 / JCM 14380 / FERM P-15431 / SF-1) TaxID=1321606 RepID=A0A0A8X9I0_MESS1|nr:ABC transporter substrate-binding protein [Mesobacillus selenatarsenatis]GAM16625.1 hydroxymethylpyrimidine ABC transporter, substrate-binding component [Mesobacillus selenatarsenatis SF-1]